MSEMERHPSESFQEGRIEHENNEVIRDELFRAYEKSFIQEYNEACPPIPEEARISQDLVDNDGKNLGMFYKIREPNKYGSNNREEAWVVIDFDDVISRTSDYNQECGRRLAEKTGIPETKYRHFYDAAKKENEYGKSVFHPNILIQALKDVYPDKSDEIEEVFASMNQKDFINQGVLRAIQSIRKDVSHTSIRISILTFGELDYQKSRVEASGIFDYIDDVIYTEGSKREVLEHLVEKQYLPQKHKDPHTKMEIDTPLPNIITVDDSPEHVDDYANIRLGSKFANIRFQHPSAKRSDKDHSAVNAVSAKETSKNQAALALYNMISIGRSNEIREKALYGLSNPGSLENIHSLLRDPERAWSILQIVKTAYPDEDITYRREGDDIVREWTGYPTPHMWGIETGPLDSAPKQEGRRLVTAGGRSFSKKQKERYNINPSGAVDDFRYKHFDPEEYILSAEVPKTHS